MIDPFSLHYSHDNNIFNNGGNNGNRLINVTSKQTSEIHSHLHFLGVDYCLNYSLNNGLYCTTWANSHLLFSQLLHGLKSLIMGCVPSFCDCVD